MNIFVGKRRITSYLLRLNAWRIRSVVMDDKNYIGNSSVRLPSVRPANCLFPMGNRSGWREAETDPSYGI